jgi:hypothetical protein
MMRRAQGQIMLAIVLAGLMVAGCVSLSSRYATRPPQGRSASEISQDEAQCEEYAKHQVKHQGDHYRVCMVSGFYAANVDMDEVSWTIGVTQTRPHEPGEVMKDMLECDRRADDAKKSDVVPPSSRQQQRVIASQAHATAGWSGEPYQHRPNATRMLVFCLQKRGYKVVPRVPR